MKKLTVLTVAMMMAGGISSATAGTRTDSNAAGAMHSSTTVHFSGLVQPATCSLKGKSMKVGLPTVNVSDFTGLSEGATPTKAQPQHFQLHVNCLQHVDADQLKMTVSSKDVDEAHNVLRNSFGTAKGIGLQINRDNNLVQLGKEIAVTSNNQPLNEGDNTLEFTANYVREDLSEDVKAGRLATDAVFLIAYK